MLEEERDRQSDSVGVEIDDGESVSPESYVTWPAIRLEEAILCAVPCQRKKPQSFLRVLLR